MSETKTAIPMNVCTSSNVKAWGHDPETGTLAVQFASGLYHFANVPADVAAGFEEAESVGRYFAQAIRPNYDGVKQQEPEEAHDEPDSLGG